MRLDDVTSGKMTTEEAKRNKFEEGRLKHGPVFQRDPISEGFDEILDLMNYLEEAVRQGCDHGSCKRLHDQCFNMAQGLIILRKFIPVREVKPSNSTVLTARQSA